MDIVEFLTARFDEDQAVAEAAAGQPFPGVRWTTSIPEWIVVDEGWYRDQYSLGHGGQGWLGKMERAENAAHATRHDPARVLAEVAAKRAILAEHATVHRYIGWLDGDEETGGEVPVCGRCVPKHSNYRRRADVPEGPCLTLRALAAPYADHPDYDPAWAVS